MLKWFERELDPEYLPESRKNNKKKRENKRNKLKVIQRANERARKYTVWVLQ